MVVAKRLDGSRFGSSAELLRQLDPFRRLHRPTGDPTELVPQQRTGSRTEAGADESVEFHQWRKERSDAFEFQ